MLATLLPAVALVLAAAAAEASSYPRYWQPVVLAGAQLPALLGRRVEQIALLRCAPPACVPIPFQVDERDDAGEWALPHGPGAAGDETPGVVDDNDDLIFLAADGGARALAGARRSGAVLEVEINDPLGFPPRYVYLAAGAVQAPRSPLRYVAYDAAADQLAGRVTLGFSGGVPQLLTLAPGGENVLDRLKIRAAASFLWGLLRVARSEQDILPQAVSWSAGPVRVIRRQALQIRMRFGIRSPRFTSTTYFYRDFAELPLSIRLRVPPRYLFTSITVRGGLDFRHLPGAWRVLLPGSDGALPAGCEGDGVTERDGVAGDWFALEGPDLTLVQRLQRGPTLASVHQSTWYRNGREEDPPESAPGQCPAAGFVLDDWDAVEGGVHTLTSTSYAVAPDVGVGVFLATVEVPLEVSVRPLPPP